MVSILGWFTKDNQISWRIPIPSGLFRGENPEIDNAHLIHPQKDQKR
jgi:hypothetical protein